MQTRCMHKGWTNVHLLGKSRRNMHSALLLKGMSALNKRKTLQVQPMLTSTSAECNPGGLREHLSSDHSKFFPTGWVFTRVRGLWWHWVRSILRPTRPDNQYSILVIWEQPRVSRDGLTFCGLRILAPFARVACSSSSIWLSPLWRHVCLLRVHIVELRARQLALDVSKNISQIDLGNSDSTTLCVVWTRCWQRWHHERTRSSPILIRVLLTLTARFRQCAKCTGDSGVPSQD